MVNCACCFRSSSVSAASAFVFQRFIVSALCQHMPGGANLLWVFFSEAFLVILKVSVLLAGLVLCVRSLFSCASLAPSSPLAFYFSVFLRDENGLH